MLRVYLFLFVNQIEKEEQADPSEEVMEEFQVNGQPQLLDSLLLDARALGQVPRLWIWRRGRHLLMWPRPMPTVPAGRTPPGSLPGGERRHLCALGSRRRVPAAPPGSTVLSAEGWTQAPRISGAGRPHCQPMGCPPNSRPSVPGILLPRLTVNPRPPPLSDLLNRSLH